MPDPEKRLALLIDADNAPASKIDVILTEVARHGAANGRRAYGNWKSPHLKGWEATLHEYAIRPIQQFAYSTGKNASDMAMCRRHGPALRWHPPMPSLVSLTVINADGDEPAHRGRQGYASAEKTPSRSNAAPRSPSRSTRAAPAPPTPNRPGAKTKTAKQMRGRETDARLRRAVEPHRRRRLGPTRRRRPADRQQGSRSRNYGYRNLSGLIEAIGLFEVKRQGQIVWVREKPKGGNKQA